MDSFAQDVIVKNITFIETPFYADAKIVGIEHF